MLKHQFITMLQDEKIKYFFKYKLFLSHILVIFCVLFDLYYNLGTMSVTALNIMLIVFLCFHHYEERNNFRRLQHKLCELVNIDTLTGLHRRDSVKYKDSSATISCVVLIDIDNFKLINDSFGHDVGDQVLQSFSGMLIDSLSTDNIAFRWGGEEFLILYSQQNYKQTLFDEVDAIRLKAQSLFLNANNQVPKFTISSGIAINDSTFEIDELVKKADIALYQAKNNGRNQTVLYHDMGH